MRKLLFCLVLTTLLLGCATPPHDPDQEPAKPGGLDQLEKAEALYQAANWQEARNQFDALIRIYPRNAYLWYKLGNALSKLGQYNDSAIEYQNAIAIDPEFFRASYNLGLIRLLQSEEALSQAKEHAPAQDALIAQIDRIRILTKQLLQSISTPVEAQTTVETPRALAIREKSRAQPSR